MVLTYDLLLQRRLDNVAIHKILLFLSHKKIQFMLLRVCSGMDHRPLFEMRVFAPLPPQRKPPAVIFEEAQSDRTHTRLRLLCHFSVLTTFEVSCDELNGIYLLKSTIILLLPLLISLQFHLYFFKYSVPIYLFSFSIMFMYHYL